MKKSLIVFSLLILLWAVFKLVKDPSGSGLWIVNKAASWTANYSKTSNLQYGDQDWQALDIYQDDVNGDTSKGVIIFLYGGGWTSGDKSDYEFIAQAFVARGYLVVVPNYVLYPKGKFPQFIDDTAQAVAWTFENIQRYDGNPDKIFLVGHSAGAYNAAMVATNDRYLEKIGHSTNIIKGVAGIAGPYNFTPKAQEYVNIFGEENFATMQVRHHVTGNEPPMLLLHSEGDDTVGLFNQETMLNALQANQTKVQSKIYSKDLSHVRILLNIHPWFATKENVGQDVDDFLMDIGL